MTITLKTKAGMLILLTLVLVITVVAQEASTCTVAARQNVNRRNGPGTIFSVAGVLAANQEVAASGQTTGADGIVWWRLTDDTWVRSDTVTELGDCDNLPDVYAVTQTPAPEMTVTLASTSVVSDEASTYKVGDEVTVFGTNAVFLIYAEPSTSARVVEATISGVVLTITAGPEESEGEVWWQVRSPSGLEGWVPEIIDGQVTLLLPGMSQPDSTSGLAVGDDVVVTGVGKVLLIHSEPGTDTDVVEATLSGVVLTITSGPEVIQGDTWWQVRSPSSAEGWIPEQINGEPTVLSPDAVAAAMPTPTATPQPVVEIAATVNTDRLNVRRGPGPEYTDIMELFTGQAVTLNGRNEEATWVQIKAGDQRWVNARFLTVNEDIASLPVTFTEIGEWGEAGQTTGVRARSTTVLRLRGGPGSEYRQLESPDILDRGQTVDVVGTSADGEWFQVNIGSRSAWVLAAYMNIVAGNRRNLPVTAPQR